MSVCLSICQMLIVCQKVQKSKTFHQTFFTVRQPHHTSFPCKHYGNIQIWKSCNFRPISRFISETIQDRATVTMECQQELVTIQSIEWFHFHGSISWSNPYLHFQGTPLFGIEHVRNCARQGRSYNNIQIGTNIQYEDQWIIGRRQVTVHKCVVCLVPLLTYSVVNIGMTLKCGLGVVQGHLKWRRSIDHMRLCIIMLL